jgi:hypothetical protein
MAKSVAVAIVQSRLDYCNSLFFGTSQHNIRKLQRIHRTLWRASSLVTHLLLHHQSSSTTFTGYQFIIALTSKLLFSHTKFLPLTNLPTSLLLLISISRLGLCVALTNTFSISPEPALSLVVAPST